MKNWRRKKSSNRGKDVVTLPPLAHLFAAAYDLSERVGEGVILHHQIGNLIGVMQIDATMKSRTISRASPGRSSRLTLTATFITNQHRRMHDYTSVARLDDAARMRKPIKRFFSAKSFQASKVVNLLVIAECGWGRRNIGNEVEFIMIMWFDYYYRHQIILPEGL